MVFVLVCGLAAEIFGPFPGSVLNSTARDDVTGGITSSEGDIGYDLVRREEGQESTKLLAIFSRHVGWEVHDGDLGIVTEEVRVVRFCVVGDLCIKVKLDMVRPTISSAHRLGGSRRYPRTVEKRLGLRSLPLRGPV